MPAVRASLFDQLEIQVGDTTDGGNAELVTVTYAANEQSIIVDNKGGTEVNDDNDGTSITITQTPGIATSSDVLSVTLENDILLALTANEYETINIASNTGANTIKSLSGTTAQNIVITGSKDLTLSAVDMEEQSTTRTANIDASAFTGDLTLVLTNDEGDQVITGGSGDDSITLVNSLDADDEIIGGDGTDTLTISDFNGDLGEVNLDVDRLVISSDATSTTGASTIDLRNAVTLTRVTVDLDDTNGDDNANAMDENVTVSNIASGATVFVLDGFAATADVLTLDGATGSNSLSVIFSDTMTARAATSFTGGLTANFDNLTFSTANAGSDISINALSAATLDNLTLAGEGNITITSATNTTSLDVLNAGSVTGNLSLPSLARAVAADITLGTGDDGINFVTTAHYGNTIAAGSGTDTLTITGASTSNIVVNLSSTTDQISSLAGAPNAAAQTGFENITATGVTIGGINVTGSAVGNTVLGTNQADTITAVGALTVTPDGGNDVITLGAGADTVIFEASATLNGEDTITGFTTTQDHINVNALTASTALTATTAGADTIVTDKVYLIAGTGTDADSKAASATIIDSHFGW
jgi:hypothetical protein